LLVPPHVNVPVFPSISPLFIQLPLAKCAKVPPLKVVDAPMVILPVMVITAVAVKLSDVAVATFVVKLPAIVKAVAVVVFTTAPVVPYNIRFP
jgi:hypothetical protein